jgi:hypothetical protein
MKQNYQSKQVLIQLTKSVAIDDLRLCFTFGASLADVLQ